MLNNKSIYLVMSLISFVLVPAWGATYSITNGGFENNFTDWRTFGTATFSITPDAYEGTKAASLLVASVGGDTGIDRNNNMILVSRGETVQITFAAKKISAGDTRLQLLVSEYDSSGIYLGVQEPNIFNVGSSYQVCQFNYTVKNSATAQLNLGFRIYDSTGTALAAGQYLIDAVSVIAYNSTIFNYYNNNEGNPAGTQAAGLVTGIAMPGLHHLGFDPTTVFGNVNTGAFASDGVIFEDIANSQDNGNMIWGDGTEVVNTIGFVTAEPVTLAGYVINLYGGGTVRGTKLVQFAVNGVVVDTFDNNNAGGMVQRIFAGGPVTGNNFMLMFTRVTETGPWINEIDAIPVAGLTMPKIFNNSTVFNYYRNTAGTPAGEQGTGLVNGIYMPGLHHLGCDPTCVFGAINNSTVSPDAVIFEDIANSQDNGNYTMGDGSEVVNVIGFTTLSPVTLAGYSITPHGEIGGARGTKLVRFTVDGSVVDFFDNYGDIGQVDRIFSGGPVTGSNFLVELTRTDETGPRIDEIDAILPNGIFLQTVPSDNFKGLVGYWKLDEAQGSSVALDSSGRGCDGDVGGDLFNGDFATFAGVGYYVNLPDCNSFDPRKSFTWSMRIKTTSDGALLARDDAGWSPGAVGLTVYNGKASFQYYGYPGVVGTSNVNDGKWHYVAVSYDAQAQVVSIFVDGNRENVTSMTSYASAPLSNDKFTLGFAPGINGYNGSMEEVRIYNTVLSQSQIVSLAGITPTVDCGTFAYLKGDVSGPVAGNRDCVVNFLDLEALASEWLKAGAYLISDVSHDSTVNFKDFAAIAADWLKTQTLDVNSLLFTAGTTYNNNSYIVSTSVFTWYAAGTSSDAQPDGPWIPLEGRENWTGKVDYWKNQIKQMMAADIDVLYVWLTTGHCEERYNLFLALAELRKDGYDVPKVAPLLDTAIQWVSTPIDLSTPAGKDALVQVYITFFSEYFLANSDTYAENYLAQIDGRVVLDSYILPATMSNPGSLSRADVASRLSAAFGASHPIFNNGIYMITPDSAGATVFSFADERVSQFQNGAYSTKVDYNGIQTMMVSPGYWDQWVRNPGSFVAQNGGTNYTAAWNQVHADLTIDRVYVQSWNEYAEGSGIYACNTAVSPHLPPVGGNTDTWSSTNDPYQYIKSTAGNARPFNNKPDCNSAILWHNIPATMQHGGHQTVTVIVRNTGDLMWTEAGKFRFDQLDSDTSNFTSQRAYIDDNDNEIPRYGGIFYGRPVMFKFDIIAPTAGSYVTHWRMVQDGGVGWFGQTITKTIVVE